MEQEQVTYAEAIAAAKVRYEPWLYYFEVLHPWAKFMDKQYCNVTSQWGEDGLIAAVFDKIGTTNKCCFEVGAADGVQISNTWILRENGWKCVLIEADETKYKQIFELCKGQWIFACYQKIGPNDLDEILSRSMPDTAMDFGVIDIDGQDYHVWDGMKKYRPRLMMVEFSSDVEPVPPVGGEGQAGINALLELAQRKNYVPIARTNCNLFFLEGGVFNANAK